MIRDTEALRDRAGDVAAHSSRNGIRMVLVEAVDADEARLDVHFLNDNNIHEIVGGGGEPHERIRLSGGDRLPAGSAEEQVRVHAITRPDPAAPVLELTVRPVGDYSTYTLTIDGRAYPWIDPLFNGVEFRFRPGCFESCPPDEEPPPAPRDEPAIDYLAKDFEGFKHTLIAWMGRRVPDWSPTSEADLDQVLIELFSAGADELSDFQDRVMNEAYLATARKRVSLVRHARLVDYHVHQGNQASAWVAFEVEPGGAGPIAAQARTLPAGTRLAAGGAVEEPGAIGFVTREDSTTHPLLNGMRLYTWSGAVPALAAGTTGADLRLDDPGEPAARAMRDLIVDGGVRHLLVQEHLDPSTGSAAGRDPRKRQLLRLLTGEEDIEVLQDPVTGTWYLRVRWMEEDRLRHDYCFFVDCDDGPRDRVSLFHGNLAEAEQGRPVRAWFRPPGEPLAVAVSPTDPEEVSYRRREDGAVLCPLPEPLLYRRTRTGGEVPPRSTLSVKVEVGPRAERWEERISLVHCDDRDACFVVETTEDGRSTIRFGDGRNGRALPVDAVVKCAYQSGHGPDGNVGPDSIRAVDPAVGFVERCWNPFDVTDGRGPETPDEVRRRAPESYRERQLRAVTLADYVDRAEELPEVDRAAARYMWTGSWRTVRITLDPVGTATLAPEVAERARRHLDAVRLIGEDLEIRPPRFVPLVIRVSLCATTEQWPSDVRHRLERSFSGGYTPDGRLAFLHPDRWTFGQPLRASQLLARIQEVHGVDHVIELSMRRWSQPSTETEDVVRVGPSEIILVRNDPDHMERGSIRFDIQGGRR